MTYFSWQLFIIFVTMLIPNIYTFTYRYIHIPNIYTYTCKAQYLVLWALWWHQLFSSHEPQPHWWVLGRKKHMSVNIYALNLFTEHSQEHWWEQNIFCLFTTSILEKLSTWCFEHSGTSVVLYSLTKATLMSPGKGKTRVCE